MHPAPLSLVATHDDFLVLHKPPDLSFHQDQTGEGAEAGLVQAVRAHLAADPATAALAEALYPVHRLDRMTSGLVLLARSAQAARDLGERFATGQMEKYYLALSARTPSKKQGWVRGCMLKGRNGSWRLVHSGEAPEAPLAVTQFFSYGLGHVAEADGQALRLFVVRPRTGRTHQIRVALKSLGSPILGDVRYSGGAARAGERNADARGYLHAYALRFMWQGALQSFSVPPAGGVFADAAVQAKLAEIGAPWALAWPQAGK